ncbi:MAG: 2-oxo acid dehydrogenase subunit E2 [Polyangiaceae bacterium]|nr:2-oxo acid dehydrogenase subunit E2 [Polyangiaceae bacterium]
MRRLQVSGQRRMMLSFFGEPSCDPYMSFTADVNLEPALGFLDAHAREHGVRAGVQHLVTAAVARCLHELPALNVKIVGREFYQLDRVDIAVPVQLGGVGSADDQTGLTILRDVDRLSLSAIAEATRARAGEERAGSAGFSGTGLLRRVARHAPLAIEATAALASRALRHPAAYSLLGPWSSVSTGITNVGAVFSLPEGARFRSVSLTMPNRMGHVASVFALAPAAEAPVVERGQIVVRKVLPVTLVVDHRAIDGFGAAKLGSRLVELLLAPEPLARPPA